MTALNAPLITAPFPFPPFSSFSLLLHAVQQGLQAPSLPVLLLLVTHHPLLSGVSNHIGLLSSWVGPSSFEAEVSATSCSLPPEVLSILWLGKKKSSSSLRNYSRYGLWVLLAHRWSSV